VSPDGNASAGRCLLCKRALPPHRRRFCTRCDGASVYHRLVAIYGAPLEAELERLARTVELFLPPDWRKQVLPGATPQQEIRVWDHNGRVLDEAVVKARHYLAMGGAVP
jgi:hypothetical protein